MAGIHYVKGDIFASNAQVIVNTVNCKGVMGKGLALTFKQKYPAMFAAYEHDCQTGKLKIGRPTLYTKSSPWILNFPTKNHWRFPSKLEYLEKGLTFLAQNYKKAGITSIAFPKLGAQNGHLSWEDVGPLMAKYLSQLDIDVYVYISDGDKEYQYDPVETVRINEYIWQEFSKLALSAEDLHTKVGLSLKEAKKVVESRCDGGFRSLVDIERIDNIAKVSIKRINDFVQKYRMVELLNLPEKNIPVNKTTIKLQKKKKRHTVNTDLTMSALFTL